MTGKFKSSRANDELDFINVISISEGIKQTWQSSITFAEVQASSLLKTLR